MLEVVIKSCLLKMPDQVSVYPGTKNTAQKGVKAFDENAGKVIIGGYLWLIKPA
jgi:hypothetical protein